MLKIGFVGHILQYCLRIPKFILKAYLTLKGYMETLRHHDARLEQNRVREIREVFISLRQLIRVVTNRYPRFPTICNFFGRNIYE